MFFSTPSVDLFLLRLINQQWQTSWLDFCMPIFSSKTVLFTIMAAIFVYLATRCGKRHLVYLFVLLAAMGVSDFTTSVVKDQIFRIRPLNAVAGTRYVEDGVWQQRPPSFVQTKERGTSYPSAHAANTMTMAVLAMLFWPALKKWPLVLTLIVGYSRVYLGKHYPTDVLAGWLWGLVVAGTIWLVWRMIERRFLPPGKNC